MRRMVSCQKRERWEALESTATLTALRSTISWKPTAIMSGGEGVEGGNSQEAREVDGSIFLALTFHVPVKTFAFLYSVNSAWRRRNWFDIQASLIFATASGLEVVPFDVSTSGVVVWRSVGWCDIVNGRLRGNIAGGSAAEGVKEEVCSGVFWDLC